MAPHSLRIRAKFLTLACKTLHYLDSCCLSLSLHCAFAHFAQPHCPVAASGAHQAALTLGSLLLSCSDHSSPMYQPSLSSHLLKSHLLEYPSWLPSPSALPNCGITLPYLFFSFFKCNFISALIPLILTTTLWSRYHFRDDEFEPERRSPVLRVKGLISREPGLKPRCPHSRVSALHQWATSVCSVTEWTDQIPCF